MSTAHLVESLGEMGVNLDVTGNVTLNSNGGGNANLNFVGASSVSIIDQVAGTFPVGAVTVDKSSGMLLLASDIDFIAAGQNLTLINGNISLANSYTLTVAGVANLQTGTSMVNCGTFDYGSIIGTGTDCPPPPAPGTFSISGIENTSDTVVDEYLTATPLNNFTFNWTASIDNR